MKKGPDDIRHQRVLLASLNWGLGHVTRDIGLIRNLLANGNEVLIAADAAQQAVFRNYFPDLQYILLDGYPFQFRGKGRFARDLFRQRNALSKRYRRELRETAALVREWKPDLLISDHRYGFRNAHCESIFVTHQFNLPLHWYQFPVQWLHHRLMTRFDHIWIVDDANSAMAGKLSRNHSPISVFIGYLSRFTRKNTEKAGHEVLIVSGPPPYAQQFYDEQVRRVAGRELFVIAPATVRKLADTRKLIHLDPNDWQGNDCVIASASKLISRCGYSTLMDLHYLQANAELIATPGQAEQEYLARLHKR